MTINFTPKTVLALAPHPDDIELGMGGTLSKLIESGSLVTAVIFSTVDKSLPAGFSGNDIKKEAHEALQCLGVKENEIIFKNYPVREFEYHRQAILEDLVQFSKDLNPEVVFCPSLSDTHQDHNVIASESVRAFRKTTVLGYELPWNTRNFDTSLNVCLDERHLAAKENSLLCYRSQQTRPYFAPGLLKNHSRVRAIVSGVEYAESFELIRMLLN